MLALLILLSIWLLLVGVGVEQKVVMLLVVAVLVDYFKHLLLLLHQVLR
jgi:hypothetical protein